MGGNLRRGVAHTADGFDIPWTIEGDPATGPRIIAAHGMVESQAQMRRGLGAIVDHGWTQAVTSSVSAFHDE